MAAAKPCLVCEDPDHWVGCSGCGTAIPRRQGIGFCTDECRDGSYGMEPRQVKRATD